MAGGDNAAAAAALAQGWSGAKQVEIVPANLDAAYAGLPKSGFARLALFESALQENAAVADSVRDALARGQALPKAIDTATAQWMTWGIGRTTSRQHGIPRGLPYLTGFVAHCGIAQAA